MRAESTESSARCSRRMQDLRRAALIEDEVGPTCTSDRRWYISRDDWNPNHELLDLRPVRGGFNESFMGPTFNLLMV
jgi:hypothetical protein